MRAVLACLLVVTAADVPAQVVGHFPPDSLLNTQVIPHSTSVAQVIGTMRNFTAYLGVRCQYCHLGEEGLPLEKFDFASDEKRTKVVARQMMRMVEEINKRLDTIPGRPTPAVTVTCNTCHRGATRPIPLSTLVQETAMAAGADSALRSYRALRQRYFGRDTYDFGEGSLNTTAYRLGKAGRFDDAFAVLRANEEQFPVSSGLSVFRGNINLMKGDSVAAGAAFREAIRRDSTNGEARGRLRDIGQKPGR